MSIFSKTSAPGSFSLERLWGWKSSYNLYSTRGLFALLTPLIIEQFLFLSVGAADGVMVAFLGETSISAVNMVDLLNVFIYNLVFALTTGGAVVVSQYLGAKKRKEANDSALQLMVVKFAFTVTMMIVALVFTHPILRFFFGKVEPQVMSQAVTYFRITSAGLPFIGMYGTCSALLRCQNKTKHTMYIAMVGNMLNIIGNALLLFVFKLGVAGAAYSTLFSRLVNTGIGLYIITNPKNEVFLTLKNGYHVAWGIIRRILFIGIPSGIENGTFQFGRLLILGLIARYGTSEIAANSIGNQLSSLSCIVGAACGLGIITVVGKCVGAGDEGQLRYYVRKIMTLTCSMHFLWNLGLLSLSPFFHLVYKNITPQTMHLALILFLIHQCFGMVMWPWSFAFPHVLRSMNDVRFTMMTSAASMIFVRVGASHLLAPVFNSGALAVWTAMVLDWVVRISCFVGRYRSNAWRKVTFPDRR